MKMFRLISGLTLLLFFAISINPTYAQKTSGRTGIGVMLGSPTGLSFKTYTSSTNAFDAGLAWSLDQYDAVNLHVDYLWHRFDAFENVDQGQLPLYYGIGGRVIFTDDYPDPGDNDALLGVRFPVGTEYLFEEAPFGIFLELAPVLNIVPSTDFDLDGALGARYYF
jgi:hypothetical protein